VRLAGRAADVDAVGSRPAHDGQAARALVAARGGAGVAEHGEADLTRGDRRGEPARRDELASEAIGEDQDRPAVVRDQGADLRRRARGDLVRGACVVGEQVARQRGDARRAHRARPPRVLRVMRDGDGRGDQRHDQDRGERRPRGDPGAARD
jgi:hypothetical protein